MKKLFFAIVSATVALVSSQGCQASSLDDLYRDIIRSDNKGYLPLFVKNRQAPDVLDEQKIATTTISPEADALPTSAVQEVSLTNPIPAQENAVRAKQLKWDQTLQAVEKNQVTPLELDEINYRLKLNDPKAIEVMAWMYTNGVGVETNYIEAYRLYKRAAALEIPQAKNNAVLLFKAMNEEQRRKIKEP